MYVATQAGEVNGWTAGAAAVAAAAGEEGGGMDGGGSALAAAEAPHLRVRGRASPPRARRLSRGCCQKLARSPSS